MQTMFVAPTETRPGPADRSEPPRVAPAARSSSHPAFRLAAVAMMAMSLAGCLGYDGEVSHGFQADPQILADVKNGSSAEQVWCF